MVGNGKVCTLVPVRVSWWRSRLLVHLAVCFLQTLTMTDRAGWNFTSTTCQQRWMVNKTPGRVSTIRTFIDLSHCWRQSWKRRTRIWPTRWKYPANRRRVPVRVAVPVRGAGAGACWPATTTRVVSSTCHSTRNHLGDSTLTQVNLLVKKQHVDLPRDQGLVKQRSRIRLKKTKTGKLEDTKRWKMLIRGNDYWAIRGQGFVLRH